MSSVVGFSQSAPTKKITQPILGHRSAPLINERGFQFKDLNKNGKLDKYEDWRLSNEERTRDLLSKMSVEEKVGFMLISTSRLKSERSAQINAPTDNAIKPSSDLNEEDQIFVKKDEK
jgi:beta-glucosidase